MKLRTLPALGALLAASSGLSAQAVKFDGALVELYYTQMLDSNLRLNSAATHAPAYFAATTGMTENAFTVKRAEVYFSGTVTDAISWSLMFDPNNTSGTNTTYGAVLQDVWANWKIAPGLTLKMGQGKFLQSYESTSISARNILFYDRSQVSRFIGERRDRGIYAQYDFGDPKGFNGKAYLGLTNGMSDNGTGGKQNETNAQKDVHARLDFGIKGHQFGVYYRTGSTDVAKGQTVPTTGWGLAGPSAVAIKENNDKMSNLGVFYFKDTPDYTILGEAATGLIGRRYPSVFSSASAVVSREHLDQKYLGYSVAGAYKMGQHWITARYDFMNFNSGNDYYGSYNPYTQNVTTGAALGADYTPKFTEINVGYSYVFLPSKSSTGKLKLNYVMRSKNFLRPDATRNQTGEQGGDSVVASLQIGF